MKMALSIWPMSKSLARSCQVRSQLLVGQVSGETPMNRAKDFLLLVRYSVHLYFAPIMGAYKGIRAEYRHVDRLYRDRRETSTTNNDREHHAGP